MADPLEPEYLAGSRTGFSFENCVRNQMLATVFRAGSLPHAT